MLACLAIRLRLYCTMTKLAKRVAELDTKGAAGTGLVNAIISTSITSGIVCHILRYYDLDKISRDSMYYLCERYLI